MHDNNKHVLEINIIALGNDTALGNSSFTKSTAPTMKNDISTSTSTTMVTNNNNIALTNSIVPNNDDMMNIE